MRETYRVESRQYIEKLRGKGERESETARPISSLPTLPPRKIEDTSHCPNADPNGHTNTATQVPSYHWLIDLPSPTSLLQPSQFTPYTQLSI